MRMIGLAMLGCSIATVAVAAPNDTSPAAQPPVTTAPKLDPAPAPADAPAPANPVPAAAPKPAPLASASALTNDPVKARINDATLDTKGVKDGVDPAVLRAEVMLDRLHDSPGVIDGKTGTNYEHALEAYEKENDLKVSKTLDKDVWDSLIKRAGAPVLVDYTLTDDDVAGPFFPDLPKDYAKLAEMKSMGYRNVAQKLGGKFHMSEDLLAELNPGVDLGRSGSHILVADTSGPPVHGKVERIFVDKGKSQVFGYDAKGHVIIAVPATIGSRELPSPSGTYKVKGVAWNPIYYYNPKNFVQGDNHEKLRLPPGPNNPVGSVFIALTKPTYGLHGTPDPSTIDKTASHGCVRMTNWDATELAHLVHPGIKVSFGKSKG